MSRREDVALAHTTSDLGDLVDQHGSIDVIRAIGAVGQRFGLALDIWRLVDEGDRKALRPVFDGLLAVCHRLGIKSDPIHVVSNVIAYLFDPKCKTCGGRGQLFDQPLPVECPDCAGSGNRPTGWGEHEMRLDDWITQEQRQAAAAISRKLQE